MPQPTIEQTLQIARAHHQAGRLPQAETLYRQILTQNPNHAEALHLLGVIAYQVGRHDLAVDLMGRAVALQPNYPEAHYNLGNALRGLGKLDAAAAAYRKAIALRPDFPEAFSNLGATLHDGGHLDEAISAYRQAIAVKPNFAGAYSNLGNALHEAGHIDAALEAYRQALALEPDNARIHGNLIYTLHYHPAHDAGTIAAELRRWNLRHSEPLKRFIQPHRNDRSPERRLRIGYVSPDLSLHPVGRFLLPLLAHHDQKHFEVLAYSQVPVADAMTQRLRAHTAGWRNIVGLSDAQAAELIRQDQIDILVDLAMHAANNRLLVLAYKPAPVQATYLAYCSSTGLPTIDYRLSDPYLDPPGMDESVYSERTLRLPETYWCYEPGIASPEIGPLPALARGYITFGCLNNFWKVSEPTLALWASLLRAVPNAQLLLHALEGSHRQEVMERLKGEGIEPQRIRFAGRRPIEQYFALYREIDMGLDTIPYGGGTTTCDALWMGVPVVSLVGKTAVGRGGLSILSNVGLPELAARSEGEYVRIASALAGDLPRLGELRSTLRQRMERSPLMDAPGFARNIEAAYRQMWRTWCATG